MTSAYRSNRFVLPNIWATWLFLCLRWNRTTILLGFLKPTRTNAVTVTNILYKPAFNDCTQRRTRTLIAWSVVTNSIRWTIWAICRSRRTRTSNEADPNEVFHIYNTLFEVTIDRIFLFPPCLPISPHSEIKKHLTGLEPMTSRLAYDELHIIQHLFSE